MSRPATRERVAELVCAASRGAVPIADALAVGASLRDLGLDSLGLLRFVDAIEIEYGLEVDVSADRTWLDSVDAVVAALDRSP